jgi:hypothetical protein
MSFALLLSVVEEIRIYRIIISPVALYGCQAWSLITREERGQSAEEDVSA